MNKDHNNRTCWYSISDKEWPLVRITFDRNPENSEEFEKFLECCQTNLYQKQKRFVLLVDPHGLSTLNPIYIYGIVSFMREMEPMTKAYMIELGLLVESSIVRKIIEWVQSLKTPAVQWYLFANQDELGQWILNLQDRQIIFPLS